MVNTKNLPDSGPPVFLKQKKQKEKKTKRNGRLQDVTNLHLFDVAGLDLVERPH